MQIGNPSILRRATLLVITACNYLVNIMWSSSVVKFWQGVMEIILRIVCLVLLISTFICLVAAASALTHKTPFNPIENLRFDTRSPLGWLLLLTIIDIPIAMIFLVLRFLDTRVVQNNIKIILCIDITVNILLSLGIACGAVLLAMHGTSWKVWRSRGTEELNSLYHLNEIVFSIGASSVFALFSMIAVIVLVVWLDLTLVLGWGNKNSRNPLNTRNSQKQLIPKITTV